MEIKYTVQGALIYLTMASYLLAFAATLLKCRKTGHVLYLLGFIIAVFSLLTVGIMFTIYPCRICSRYFCALV